MHYSASSTQTQFIARIVLIALSLNVLQGDGAFVSFVLCLGKDGHIAVENVGHAHRANHSAGARAQSQSPPTIWATVRKASTHESSQNARLTDHKPCLDLPIDQNDQGSRSEVETISQPLINTSYVLLTIAFCWSLLAPIRFPFPQRAAVTNPIASTPALRRSTVLLN